MIEKFLDPIEKIDIFEAQLGDNFVVAQRLLDIRQQAESIARMADKKVEEDGEFAKLYAKTIADWMLDIACVANQAVEVVVAVNGKSVESP